MIPLLIVLPIFLPIFALPTSRTYHRPMTRLSNLVRTLRAVRTLGFIVALASTAACGGSSGPTTQPQARDQGAAALCAHFKMCGQIGPGQMYTSDDDCLTQAKSLIQGAWPPAECTTIDQTGFSNCVGAVNAAACDNAGDALNILLNKCTKASVCKVP